MPVLAFLSLLRENKKIQWQNVNPSGDRTWASHNLWFQVQLSSFWASEACASEEIFKLLFMHHLILDLDDLVRINRAWLYKEPKVWVLQANAKLVQKG